MNESTKQGRHALNQSWLWSLTAAGIVEWLADTQNVFLFMRNFPLQTCSLSEVFPPCKSGFSLSSYHLCPHVLCSCFVLLCFVFLLKMEAFSDTCFLLVLWHLFVSFLDIARYTYVLITLLRSLPTFAYVYAMHAPTPMLGTNADYTGYWSPPLLCLTSLHFFKWKIFFMSEREWRQKCAVRALPESEGSLLFE